MTDQERAWGIQEWITRKGESAAIHAGTLARSDAYAAQDQRVAESGLPHDRAHIAIIMAQQKELEDERAALRRPGREYG